MLHWYLARGGLLRTGIFVVHVDSPAVLGHGRDGIGRNRRGCGERDDERCQISGAMRQTVGYSDVANKTSFDRPLFGARTWVTVRD